MWPVVINDGTLSQECVVERRLVLLTKFGLLGAARITLTLVDLAGVGCRIGMSEKPVRGQMKRIPYLLALAAYIPAIGRACGDSLARRTQKARAVG